MQNILVGPAIAHANEVVEVARSAQADVVLADGMLYGAMIGAQGSRLPSVALTHVPYGFTQLSRDAAADDPRRAVLESGLGVINQARAQFALPPLASVFDQIDELDLNAVLSVPELDSVTKLPDNLRYIGPAIDNNTAADMQIVPDGAQTVLVSFSTGDLGQLHRDVLQGVLDALATSDFRVIVTVGQAFSPDDFRVPSNATAHTYLPHSAILSRTDVVVTHAGHGTVMAALGYGVPMVCLPLGRDQPYNAARVAAVGAGLRLAPTARGSEIADAVKTVVTTPAFNHAAAGLRQAIERTSAHGLDELERVGRTSI
jgi:MGT family glycosyltransferase